MNNTITLTDKQMKALQSGQSITIEPPKPAIVKWEPKGGFYCVYGDLSTDYVKLPSNNYIKSGMTYKTQSQAEQAARVLRSYARQLAWLAENDDGWVADWNNISSIKYYVSYNHTYRTWKICNNTSARALGNIYMSEDNAKKLCQLLNDEIVEF